MANPVWKKILGVINGYLKFGFKGPHLEKDATDDAQLNVFANNGSSDAKVKVATAKVKTLEVADADGTKTTIGQPDMAADLILNLPTTDGNAGDSLMTDGDGNTYWSGGGSAADITGYEYTVNFGTSSPVNLLNAPAGSRIKEITVEVVTPFDGTAPTLAVGIAGTTERFVAAADLDLKNAGIYSIDVEDRFTAGGQIIGTYAADGSTAGQAKVTIYTYIPQS